MRRKRTSPVSAWYSLKKRAVCFGLFLGSAALLGMLKLEDVSAQKPSSSEVSATSESLGLGQLRMDSGYSPINLTRPDIRPGMPFDIKPTMDSFISGGGGGGSFGGLLNRYDMSGFGKIFETRTRVIPTESLTRTLPPPQDTTVVNTTDEPRMYPPRIVINYEEFPSTNLEHPEVRSRIDESVKDILSRAPLSAKETIQVFFEGDKLILRGQIASSRTVELLTLGLGMEPGVGAVVNEIEVIPELADRQSDPLGYEL